MQVTVLIFHWMPFWSGVLGALEACTPGIVLGEGLAIWSQGEDILGADGTCFVCERVFLLFMLMSGKHFSSISDDSVMRPRQNVPTLLAQDNFKLPLATLAAPFFTWRPLEGEWGQWGKSENITKRGFCFAFLWTLSKARFQGVCWACLSTLLNPESPVV